MNFLLGCIGLLFLVIFFLAAGVFFVSWLIMLAFGISHSIDSQIPAIGFWACIPFAVVLSILGGGSVIR